jgi:hypothetical protein
MGRSSVIFVGTGLIAYKIVLNSVGRFAMLYGPAFAPVIIRRFGAAGSASAPCTSSP